MHIRSMYDSHLNGISVLQHFECSNAIDIRNEIMFDFNSGLPHIQQDLK